jgi:CxxC motif-containing protein (DUF1111 family)
VPWRAGGILRAVGAIAQVSREVERKMRLYRIAPLAAAIAVMTAPTASMQSAITEAPTGFDDVTNGHITQEKFDANKEIFDEVEEIDEGLGPVYNQGSCKACHSNPVSGGISQVTELRAGRAGATFFQPQKRALKTKQAAVFIVQETGWKI